MHDTTTDRSHHRAGFGAEPAPTSGDRDRTEPPLSAARLAAERAFSAPSIAPEPVAAPSVTVRRKRGPGEAADRDTAAAGDDADAPAAAGAKEPRIFRVPKPHSAAGTALPPQALRADGVAAGTAIAAKPRRRRVPDQRPGPVVQVFAAPEPPAADSATGVSPRQLAELAAMLAGIEPVLQDIRRAQALRFLPESAD